MRRMWRASLTGVMLLICGFIVPLCTVTHAASDDLESQRNAALARINQWRAAIGVAPLARHPALDQSAQAHARYYQLNSGSGGVGIHDEKPGLPGFTGADFFDRALAAGYPSRNVNENMGLSGNQLTSLDWYINTINHRLTLLDPRYVHIGFGVVNDTVKVDVIDVGTPAWSATADPAWEQWPPDGASGIGTSFDGESPNAFASASYPIGTPITLKYNGAGGVTFTSVTITTRGQTVPSFANTGTGWLSKNTDLIATTTPMQPGTEYTVTVTGAANGQQFSRTWGFRTRAVGDPASVIVPGAPPVSKPASVASQPTTAPTPTTAPISLPTPSPTPTATPVTTATAASALPPSVVSNKSIPILPPSSRALPLFPAAPVPPTTGYRLPNGVNAAPGVIGTAWSGGDGAVAAGKVTRSWLYGPDAVTTRMEPYAESPGGMRTVFYFDKARMELTTPTSGVSNGLLVTEMVSGAVQVGNAAFQSYHPAAIPVAGDATNNDACPTYATLWGVASFGDLAKDRRAATMVGQPVTATIDSGGHIGDDPSRAGYAVGAHYDANLGHNVPDVFWNWMQTLPADWQTLLGLPITEPYWTQTRVGGTLHSVLMQAFERRVLTYTPDNAPTWQVEMGNVGLHFLLWHDSLT
ncbi:MAG: CAP domain-containing protein [Chloroflexota bacterium]|nr:CAP domain-containing protein [Chloroflexota bacterium]